VPMMPSMRIQDMMMQRFLPDQDKIRRRLGVVNKIETWSVAKKGSEIHAGMYWKNMPACIGGTWRHVFAVLFRWFLMEAGEGS